MQPIQLNFRIEPQKDSRLCWAAVSVSLACFYQQDNVITQVELAKKIFGEKYNQFCCPEKALSVLGNFVEAINRPLKEEEIVRELQNQRPIAACMEYFVGWHLVVIHGIDTAKKLSIADPLLGDTQWDIDTFTKSYHQNYRWVKSYRTIRHLQK